MLKSDKIEPVPISVPVVIDPETAPGAHVDTLPMAPAPIRMARHHWGRAAARVLKICLLLSEIPIFLALVAYAGVLHLLPATPPAAEMSVAGHTVRAAAGTYCWFRPGHADCAVPTTPPASGAVPQIAAAKGSSVALTFAYPPPTDCATTAKPATAPISTGTGTGKPAGALAPAGTRTLMLAHYTLTVDLAPGRYRVDLTCQWQPLAALRWLQGSGSATYSMLVDVVAPSAPTAKPPTK